jgi:integrase
MVQRKRYPQIHPYHFKGSAATSGTLRERPAKSGRWELRAYVDKDPETGKPRQVSRVFRGGKREAVKALDKLVHEVSDGQHVGVAASFGKLLDEWMERIIRRRRARSTAETYEIHIEKAIKPSLGSVRLDKLTACEVDAHLSALEAKGLAGGTVKLEHAIIRSALSQGVRWKWIPSNPAKESAPDIGARAEAPSVTPDQLHTLYFAAAAEDEDMAAAIALGALTGCRRGELCGLQWRDVDWEKDLHPGGAGVGAGEGRPAPDKDQDRQGPHRVCGSRRSPDPRGVPGRQNGDARPRAGR